MGEWSRYLYDSHLFETNWTTLQLLLLWSSSHRNPTSTIKFFHSFLSSSIHHHHRLHSVFVNVFSFFFPQFAFFHFFFFSVSFFLASYSKHNVIYIYVLYVFGGVCVHITTHSNGIYLFLLFFFCFFIFRLTWSLMYFIESATFCIVTIIVIVEFIVYSINRHLQTVRIHHRSRVWYFVENNVSFSLTVFIVIIGRTIFAFPTPPKSYFLRIFVRSIFLPSFELHNFFCFVFFWILV